MPVQFEVFGSIGEFGLQASDFAAFLAEANGDDVEFIISSPGGKIFEGLAIQNFIRDYAGKTTANIVGVALSMASGIAVVCDEIVMAENALMMVHEPSAGSSGTAADMAKAKAMLEKAHESLVLAYSKKTGRDENEITDLMAAETWMSADEALALGFIDRVIEPSDVVAMNLAMPSSVRVPACHIETLANLFEPRGKEETTVPETKPNDSGPVAATLDEILALDGATNDFAVEQLKRKATLSEVQNELCKLLLNQAKAERDRADKAEADKADAAKEAAKQAQNKGTSAGVDPVDTSGDGDGDGSKWSDPYATFQELYDAERKRTPDNAKALARVHRKNKGLLEAVRNSAKEV